jgi:fused signal recognition particle receptor
MSTALLLVLIAIAVVVVAGVAFVGLRSRGKGVELEPPARARPEPQVATPADAADAAIEAAARAAVEAAEPPAVVEAEPEPEVRVRPTFRDRLAKARGAVSGYWGSILSRSGVDDETWDELEEALIRADVGAGLTTELLDELRTKVKADGITESAVLLDTLKADIATRLDLGDRSLRLDADATNVWLFVGVNGVGKTTTIGKLAKRETEAGWTVVLAAGDTFRAAAAEQLETWATRAGAQFVRGADGADPSSVVYDGIEAAAARGADLVLADTAGRLHNKSNLMDELRKVRRVADKDPGHVTEVLLVLDATTGQNGLAQAREFTNAVDLTGVVLTKLDGSAKGGIVLAIQSQLGIPVKLVGVGESADDLVEFEPQQFVDALFSAE